MNSPSMDLIDEHGGIMVMLKIMDAMSMKLINGQPVVPDHLYKVTEFLTNFADACHHGKEEGILFPELSRNEAVKPFLNELLGEHKTGRDLIRGMKESLESYQPGNPDAVHIATNMQAYGRLLVGHIQKENTQLFPLAEQELSDSLQTEIKAKFDQLERDVIGIGKHEEYHSWLEELKAAYQV